MVRTSAMAFASWEERTKRTSFGPLFLCKELQELWPKTGSEPFGVVSRRTFTRSLIADISEVLERLKVDAVYLRDVQELQEYLERFPGIVDVLVKAVREVKAHLPEAKLFLGMYRDPEMEDRYPLLCARVKEYDETFMERLEKAEAEFIGRLAGMEGWLQLTTDFQDPEHDF